MITRANRTVSVLMAFAGALALGAPAALAQVDRQPADPDFHPDYEPDYDAPAPPPPAATPPTTTVAVIGVETDEEIELEDDPIGVTVFVGGGISGFTDEALRDATADVGGVWEVRAAFGTDESVFGGEVAYVGTAIPLEIPGEDATLVSSGAEGVLRLNVVPMEAFTAYALGGIGWTRYDVTGADVEVADTGIRDSDNIFQVPVGAGLSYKFDNGVVADGRFTYRASMGEDLVLRADPDLDSTVDLDEDAGAEAMDTWGVTARVGYQF